MRTYECKRTASESGSIFAEVLFLSILQSYANFHHLFFLHGGNSLVGMQVLALESCCQLGIAPRAQPLKANAQLLHLTSNKHPPTERAPRQRFDPHNGNGGSSWQSILVSGTAYSWILPGRRRRGSLPCWRQQEATGPLNQANTSSELQLLTFCTSRSEVVSHRTDHTRQQGEGWHD